MIDAIRLPADRFLICPLAAKGVVGGLAASIVHRPHERGAKLTGQLEASDSRKRDRLAFFWLHMNPGASEWILNKLYFRLEVAGGRYDFIGV